MTRPRGTTSSSSLAIVGAGPTASSLLERLSANVVDVLGDRRPAHPPDRPAPRRHRPGVAGRQPPRPVDELAGRGRHHVHRRLGHLRRADPPGPVAVRVGAHRRRRGARRRSPHPSCVAEIRALHRHDFPTRRVQSAYLDWFHRRVLDVAAADGDVSRSTGARGDRRASIVDDGRPARRRSTTARRARRRRRRPRPRPPRRRARRGERAFAELAAAHGLTFIPAGHTAELDLVGARSPASDVIALGFGQAFTDLLVLLTEGRGGRFVDDGRRLGALRAERRRARDPRRLTPRRAVPLEDRLPPAGRAGAPAPVPHRRRGRRARRTRTAG